jgi:hypothetical protein
MKHAPTKANSKTLELGTRSFSRPNSRELPHMNLVVLVPLGLFTANIHKRVYVELSIFPQNMSRRTSTMSAFHLFERFFLIEDYTSAVFFAWLDKTMACVEVEAKRRSSRLRFS